MFAVTIDAGDAIHSVLATEQLTCLIPTQEPVQPNRIDEVSRNFVCYNEGYFADVNYG